MEEIWKPIVTKNIDYTGKYEVSNLGRVKRVGEVILAGCRNGGKIRTIKEKLLTIYHVGDRMKVSLKKGALGTNYCVHMLVARAHVPNPENKVSAHLIDGDYTNCRSDNIAWGYKPTKKKKNGDRLIDLGLYANTRPDPTKETMLREVMYG